MFYQSSFNWESNCFNNKSQEYILTSHRTTCTGLLDSKWDAQLNKSYFSCPSPSGSYQELCSCSLTLTVSEQSKWIQQSKKIVLISSFGLLGTKQNQKSGSKWLLDIVLSISVFSILFWPNSSCRISLSESPGY